MSKLEAIIFDFGGTLDSDGMHSRTLFFNTFKEEKIITNEERSFFQDGYSFADQKIINEKLALNLNLVDSNRLMVSLILSFMKLNREVNSIADKISSVQVSFFKKNRPILETLKKNYRLGIISNFSGNLEIILKEYHLREYFEMVLDSYHVGYSKPDEQIFKKALHLLKLQGPQCLFVGDNIERDILPSKNLQMKTALIYEKEKKTNSKNVADYEVTDLRELLDLIQKR